MGLDDIKNKIVRTPLKPIQTLWFAPLRLIRAVRFANKLNLKIMPEIFEVGIDPEI